MIHCLLVYRNSPQSINMMEGKETVFKQIQLISSSFTHPVYLQLSGHSIEFATQIQKSHVEPPFTVSIACEQAIHLGELGEVTREQQSKRNSSARGGERRDSSPFLRSSRCSRVLSRLASLAINGELSGRLQSASKQYRKALYSIFYLITPYVIFV